MSRPSKPAQSRARKRLAKSRRGRAGRSAGERADVRGKAGRLEGTAGSMLAKHASVERGVEAGKVLSPPLSTIPTRRTRTILLLEGTNDATGRPMRVYIRPNDTLVVCETVGQMERKV